MILGECIALWGKREQVYCSTVVLVCCMRVVLVKHTGRLLMHSVGDVGFIREHFKIALRIVYMLEVWQSLPKVKSCKTVTRRQVTETNYRTSSHLAIKSFPVSHTADVFRTH